MTECGRKPIPIMLHCYLVLWLWQLPGVCLCGTVGSCMHILLLITGTVPGHAIYIYTSWQIMPDTCMPATVTLCKLAGCGLILKLQIFPTWFTSLGPSPKCGTSYCLGRTVGQRDQLRDCPARCGTVGRSAGAPSGDSITPSSLTRLTTWNN